MRTRPAMPWRAQVGLFTVLLIGLAVWLSILVVVLAMCRAAAHDDGIAGLDEQPQQREGITAEPPAPGAVLAHH